ncbi:MAG TPA: NUDIX hydrolase [Nocardioidaceae bacterium]|nr:NUDIX hydrolase [Nocardioidaceae bacterium]
MDPTRRLPAHMVGQVREFAGGARTPAEPRDASTIVLMRTGVSAGPGALEVYLLRRHVDMAFAAGMAVFPGGGVDPRDFDQEVAWVGPTPSEWAALLDTDESLARALVCAAVRETFEESGVLFAGTTDDSVVADTTGADWEADRRRLEARELSFTDFLRQRKLRLRTDLLRVWGCWQTPVFEPRRYRTRFFVAELPAGQHTRDVSTESEDVVWLSVRDAINAVDAEQMLMLPPQYCTCLELFEVSTPGDALASAEGRDCATVEPSAEIDGQGAYLTIPDRLVALSARVQDRIRR